MERLADGGGAPEELALKVRARRRTKGKQVEKQVINRIQSRRPIASPPAKIKPNIRRAFASLKEINDIIIDSSSVVADEDEESLKRQEKKESGKEEKKTWEDVISLLDDEVSLGEEEALFEAPKVFEEGVEKGRSEETYGFKCSKEQTNSKRMKKKRNLLIRNGMRNFRNWKTSKESRKKQKKALTLLLNVRQKALDIQDDAQRATNELQKLLGKMKKEKTPAINEEGGNDWPKYWHKHWRKTGLKRRPRRIEVVGRWSGGGNAEDRGSGEVSKEENATW
uniref:RRP15-like protein n=1 Tax=Globodera rostochiensis TaxID=31243 RepID=A0A914HR65_GLORO